MNRMEMRWAQSVRKHRVGRGSAKFVVGTAIPYLVSPADRDPQVWWVGPDDRGRVLEVAAVWSPTLLLVIHVMPVALRERKNR